MGPVTLLLAAQLASQAASQSASQAALPLSTTQSMRNSLEAPVESFNRWFDQQLVHWLKATPPMLWAIHLALGLVVTVLMAWLCGWVCRRLAIWSAKHERRLSAELLKLAAPTLRWIILLAGLSDAIEDAWPAVKGPARWLAGTLFVLSAIVATRGGVRLLRLLLDSSLRPSLKWPKDKEDSEPSSPGHNAAVLLPLVQRLASLLVWTIGLIMVLDHFGQNVGSVVAALGVTSLAIGLAAQQALSNIIAGLVLAVDHPFRIGDRLKLPSGDCGEVLELGMRATHIRLPDGSLLVVPNADLVSSRLVNQSTESAVRAEVRVTVPVAIDIERLSRELLDEAALVEPEPLPIPPPRVQLLTVSDKVELALIFWLPRAVNVPPIEEKLRRAALKRLQALLPAPVAATAATPPAPAPAAGPNSGPNPSPGR